VLVLMKDNGMVRSKARLMVRLMALVRKNSLDMSMVRVRESKKVMLLVVGKLRECMKDTESIL